MKCQTCGFITDPAKDLCGRCFGDLRQQKIALGFSVIDATSTYEELLAKRVKIVASKSSESKEPENKSFFRRLFRKREVALPDLGQALQEENDSGSTSFETLNEDPIHSDMENALPEGKESSSLKSVDSKPQKLRLSKRQKRQMQGLLRQRKLEEADLDIKIQSEIEAKALQDNRPERLNFSTHDLLQADLDLWNQSFDEIVKVNSNIRQQTAIQVSSLLNKDSQAALSVYFDLAFDELADPIRKKEFVKTLGDKKVEAIESEELNVAMGLFHKDSARLEKLTHDAGPGAYPLIGKPANMLSRFISWAFDVSSAFLISLFIGFIFYASRSSLLSDLSLGVTALHLSDILSVAIYALPTFYVLILFLFPLLRIVIGCTFGEFVTNLRLFSVDSKRLSFEKSFDWNLLSIISLVSLGFLERRRGQYLWREKILGARLLRT